MSTNIATASSRARIARRIAAEARPSRDYRFMEFCGGHTHAISRYGIEDSAARKYPHDSRARLSGLRAADGPHRRRHPPRRAPRGHALHLCRSDARAGLGRLQPDEGEGRRRRHSHGLFDARRHRHRREGARTASRVLRHRLRDHDAADRARHSPRAEEGPRQFLRSSAITC